MVERSEGKRLLGKPKRGREYNIKIDLQEIGWGGVDWIDLMDERNKWRAVVNTVMNLRVLKEEWSLLTS